MFKAIFPSADKINSIRIKLPAFITLVVMCSVLLVSTTTYYLANLGLTRTAIKNLDNIAKISASEYEFTINAYKQQVIFLANMPPIQGIIRARKNRGYDPVGNSTEAQWLERLASIYTSAIATHSGYYQVRFIGVANNGKEIIRANRVGFGINVATRSPHLPEKQHRYYMKKTLQLPKGSVYVSQIDLNRENNEIEKPYTPVIRFATPVFDGDKVYGVVVINVYADSLFTVLRNALDKNYTMYAVNKNNDFLYYPGSGLTYGSELGQPDLLGKHFPTIKTAVRQTLITEAEPSSRILEQNNQAFGFATAFNNKKDPTPVVTFIITTPTSLIEKSIQSSRDVILLATLIIFPLVLLVALTFAHKISSRIGLLTDSIRHMDNDNPDVEPLLNAKDELGSLARAFKEMQIVIGLKTHELEESELRHRSILQTLVDAVITIDRKGIVTSFNRGAENIFNWHANEVIGKNINMLMPCHDEDGQQLENYFTTGHQTNIGEIHELEAKRKDGTTFPIGLTVTKMELGGEIYFTNVMRDITRRKEAEKIIQAREQALLRSNQELEKFAYIASHDLQEPLRKVQAFSDRLKTKYGSQLEGAGLDYIERMTNAAGRMRTLITDLLAFSRVSTKGAEFAKTNLNDVLLGVLDDLEIRISETGARIEYDPLPAIDADALQLRQLFQNIIGNALKFQKPDEPIRITIKHSIRKGKDIDGFTTKMCNITIADNGIGFEQQFADKIFDVFQRLHNRTEYEGTGVGLAICRRIVERHGGTIRAESLPGQGATFYISIRTEHADKRDMKQ